ncbi:30S ribosomal protein S7 [Candidatus Bathyarchaeota archaeon]|nr:30S ribosomal protein S7 [Candidatus Bathyarchaeota archaeon]
MTEETETPEQQGNIKLWGKWSFEGTTIQDPGLKRYINLHPIYTPHSGGRHEHQQFAKSNVNIVERFINNMMRRGSVGGKKAKATNIVKAAFEIIYLKTGRNPVEVIAAAVENSAPCEDTTRIGFGGIVYHRAVDISPQRRVDIALRFLSEGARKAAEGRGKPIEERVAEELIAASQRDSRSFAVSKRDEMERVALASR